MITKSAGAVEYTDSSFAEGYDPTATRVRDMTLNNLMVEIWGMRNILSLPSLPGSLWPGVGCTW